MRLQLMRHLICGAVTALVVAGSVPAFADGTVSVRGVYYKERATRVEQPMVDATFDVGDHGVIDAHMLVDSITSASASAGAADAAAFTERRYEGGIGYTHMFENLKLGGDTKYSTESDYTSFYFGGRTELELAQKNAVLGLGGGISFDKVSTTNAGGLAVATLACEPGQARESCPLTTYSLYATASQILSRNALVSLSYDISALRGFTSNPYRLAIAGNQFVPENHPTERLRQAWALSARYYLPATQTTFVGAYRYYRDDWKIHAHTPEIRAIQQVGSVADATFRYRYYRQNAAFFFRDRYDDAMGIDGFVSDDVKLSAFSSHLLEAKLGVLGEAFGLSGKWGPARFEGILQYVVQHNRFGNAIIAHVALTVPFSY
jgi:uncharacterized protein DUF3570